MLIDMKSHQVSIYKNGKLVNTFKSLFIVDNIPLHVACTLHYTNDEIHLVHNTISFEREQLLNIYAQLEDYLKLSWKMAEAKRQEFKMLALRILGSTDDVLVGDAINALQNVIAGNSSV
jgi:hypothetical protein